MPTLLIVILTALITSASTVVIMSLLIMSGSISRLEEAAADLNSLTLTDEVEAGS
jgi:Zn-dependent protease with chaperone function